VVSLSGSVGTVIPITHKSSRTRLIRVLGYILLSVSLAACASKADKLMEAGRWEEAAAAYQEALKDDSFNPALQTKLTAARGRVAAIHAERGRAMLKARNTAGAIEALKLSLFFDPTNPDYHAMFAEATRYKEAEDNLSAGQKFLKAGRLEEAAESFEQALARDPDLKAAQDGLIQVAERQRAGRNVIFTRAAQQPITLRFQNARTKEVFESLARAGGINFMFDKDLKDDPVTVFLKDGTFEEALNLIMTTQNLFMRRVGPDTMLIIPKTKQKLDQYQDLIIRTFYLSNGKAKDLVNLLRTMLESKRVYVNEELNAIVIRDTPDKVRLAERIINANDRKPGEVLFEIEVLEVDKTKSDKFGVNIAKQAGAAVVPPGQTSPTFPGANPVLFNWEQLTSLNPTSYLFLLPTSVLLDFLRSQSDAKTLANPKIRVVNNKQAKINIGDKVPILLSTTNTIPGTGAGTVPTQSTITSIEFKDVGVKLTVEPTIHLNSQVTLKLQLEVTRLGDQITLQQSPLVQQFKFGTRTAETVLTLKDGESVVIGGLLQDEERTTVSKVPGFGDIPALGWLFKSTTKDVVRTDVILTITPRIIRGLEMPGADEQSFWSGTEETYSLKPLFDAGQGAAVSGLPPISAVPPPPPAQSFGVPTPPGTFPSSAPPGPGGAAPLGPGGAAPPGPSGTALPGPPLRNTMLAVRPPDGTVAVGQETRVDFIVSDADALVESTFTITYDPKVLEFRQALEGEFLKREGTATMTVKANPATGTAVLQLKRAPGDRGVTGGGVLASVAFLGKAQGVSPVGVQAPQLLTASRGMVPVVGGQGVMRVR
jgi:general secretion pathway protein D